MRWSLAWVDEGITHASYTGRSKKHIFVSPLGSLSASQCLEPSSTFPAIIHSHIFPSTFTPAILHRSLAQPVSPHAIHLLFPLSHVRVSLTVAHTTCRRILFLPADSVERY